MSFDSLLSRLTENFAKELSERFDRLQVSNPSESFYGIATCHESDSYSCYFAAQSEEAIRRELESRAAPSGKSVTELSADRYWIPEWDFEDSAAFVLDLHREIWEVAERDKLDYEISGRKVFDAYVAGLRLFEDNGGLQNFDRDQFILVPWVHDPGDENQWVMQAVKKLNPSSVAEAFVEGYGYAD